MSFLAHPAQKVLGLTGVNWSGPDSVGLGLFRALRPIVDGMGRIGWLSLSASLLRPPSDANNEIISVQIWHSDYIGL